MEKGGQVDSFQKAESAFQSLLDLGYTRPYLYRNNAIIKQDIGDYDGALATLDAMAAEYPDDYSVALQKTWILIEIENNKFNESRSYGEAKKAYEETLEKARDSVSDQEVQMLTAKINEIKTKGW